MSDTSQIIGSAMRTEAEVLRVISQNIANMQTVAYRRQVPVTHVQFDQLVNASASAQAQAAQLQSVQLPQFDVAIDQKTATLKSTGEPSNVALDGPGFFVVQTEQGPALTRRGDFHVAPDGTLVSSSGDVVLGEKGALQIGSGALTISSDGVVSVNDSVIDQLRIANVANNVRLASLGDGTYRVDPQQLEEASSRPSVRQGFLETSNVVPVNEMIQLMETVRRFEAEQKFARAYDGMLNQAISELGKIS